MAKKTGKSAAQKAKSDSISKSRVSNDTPPPRKKPRRLKSPTYQSFKLQKRIRHPVRLPSVFKMTKMATSLVWQNKKVLLKITIVYGLLNLIFVRGLAGGTDLSGIKEVFDSVFTGNFGSVASGLGVFVTLLGSSGNTSNETAGAYQAFLLVIASLTVIWALRQLTAGKTFNAKTAYYKGCYPLVPFILVLLVIGLQLVPLVLGSALYSTAVSYGIAVGAGQFAWLVLCCLLGLLSVYMLTSSIFALYIVTLPDMTPLKALRSARNLVRFRRWTVLRKVLWLPFFLILLAAVIMVPIIIWLTALAAWIFFILTMFALLAVHAYMYTLYRELLNE